MRTVYFVGYVIVLVLLVIDCSLPSPALTPSLGEVIPIKIDAASLFAEYDANDIKADQKYKGKQLEVTGVITAFGSDLFGNPTLLFGVSDGESTGVLATFGKDRADTVATLSKGQRVTILGQCDGMRIQVQLKYAAIIK